MRKLKNEGTELPNKGQGCRNRNKSHPAGPSLLTYKTGLVFERKSHKNEAEYDELMTIPDVHAPEATAMEKGSDCMVIPQGVTF